ncbi:uncharacterized protein LOC112568305 [Pomacea canaliculata]|uniref:uncharacterized protein LOC112568305 n=1 Tax=Pomacea canaliculata TaxID=400727 RepID=UPI000D726F77|nr:uncharacterized protein LOC112568305 [Pomacea canaliculata]
MPFKIKEVMCYFLLLPVAISSTKTECSAVDRRNLVCSFPFNVNSTQRDYGVYFYPDDGGEEPLLDCAWIHSQLHCIKQKDIEYKHPVSTLAEITIPRSFADRNGSYRCVPEGHRHHSIKSCRLPEEKDKDISTSCDAMVALDKRQVIINCNFSVTVHSFIVKTNTTVVGSFTTSVCQNSTVCSKSPSDKAFTLTLDLTGDPNDEYFCHADQLLQQVVVKGCTPPSYALYKSSSAPALAAVLSSVDFVIVFAVTAGVV